MNKTEIRVTIDSVEKQQRAIEILERYKQPILDKNRDMYFNHEFKNLYFNLIVNAWFIGMRGEWLNEITLDKLEEMLKNEKK